MVRVVAFYLLLGNGFATVLPRSHDAWTVSIHIESFGWSHQGMLGFSLRKLNSPVRHVGLAHTSARPKNNRIDTSPEGQPLNG
jgi:hypothetical protein